MSNGDRAWVLFVAVGFTLGAVACWVSVARGNTEATGSAVVMTAAAFGMTLVVLAPWEGKR